MAKKFKIKDGEDEIIVEEMDEEKPAAAAPAPAGEGKPSEVHDEDLSSEEISALKELAKVAPDLVALVKKPAAPAAGSSSETHDGETEEEKKAREEAEAAKKAEEEKKAAVADSKKGFGAVETKDSKAGTFDAEQNSIEIEDAWSKRYGGAK